MRRLALFLSLTFAVIASAADTEALARRAARAFEAGEWASAHAMYMRVSDAKPQAAVPYGRTIFAALMRGDTTTTSATVKQALSNHVPLDSVLSVIEQEALARADGKLYVAELHRLGRELPYLRRPVDARLLDYYSFRSDAPMMIRYANALLRGLPDSPRYLNVLAEAYLIQGNISEATATWRRTLDADPDNLDALLGLGNALYGSAPEEAIGYLRHADQIRPTPYLEQRITDLSKKLSEQ